ncbi:MAG: dihydrodipicolinate synthase family protein [Planctomycetaceae bacterium]|jgi:4-hydroxy-tetrahydrodipicolinate synthase|nr:dihydrodipicolinate synthase family protein [bacterium]MDC0307899.1 dihydrodipicolinate synthase family protein [Planctomycetaceae bacterium]MDG2388800.1 dihydrodipicolinate synthase family protein [Planctomycetaceae bacterium]
MPAAIDINLLQNVHLVPLTAFTSEGTLDLGKQTEHIQNLVSAGIRVFLPAAGTSEFHSLSDDEIVQLVRVTREAAGSEATIFAPVGRQIGSAIKVGTEAMAAGADGVMFMPFEHPYLSDQGALAYYRDVMKELRCPVMIYKKAEIPSDNLLLNLARDPRMVGVKYSVNNMAQFRQTVLTDTTDTQWLCGSAERFAPFFMLAGSTGYTTGAGNLCPRLTLAMFDALTTGTYEEAMKFQELILPIEHYRARAGDSYNITMLKHGLKLTGLDFGPPRSPGRILTAAEETEIEELLEPIFAAEKKLGEEMLIAGQ